MFETIGNEFKASQEPLVKAATQLVEAQKINTTDNSLIDIIKGGNAIAMTNCNRVNICPFMWQLMSITP